MIVTLTGCTLFLDERRVEWTSDSAPLSGDEALLLVHLAERAGHDVSRDDLGAAVWGDDSSDAKLSRLIWRVRRKVEIDPQMPRHLLTIHGGGYRLVPKADDATARPIPAPVIPVVLVGPHAIDLTRRVITGPTGETTLTANEAQLLQFLVEHPETPWSRAELQTKALGYRQGVSSRAVDNLVTRLREKLEPDPREPVHLLTVRGEGYRLRIREETVSTLPPPLPRFMGRDSAQQALDALTQEAGGITTVLGPGGAGKTTLVVQWANARWRAGDVGPFLFVDLSACFTEADFVTTVGTALGMTDGADDPIRIRTRIGALAGGLVVFDNLEQLLPAAAQILSRWVQIERRVALVATSRERLRIRSERVLPLGSMEEADAVALFQERVRAMGQAPGEETEVAALVHELDAMPLAIEMAASLSGVVPLAEIMGRVAGLASAEVDRPDRHASLEAVFDWSWNLLSVPEQQALAALASLPASFSVETARALTEGGTLLVPNLRDKSLLQAVGEHRFAVFQALRAWASSRVIDPARFHARAADHFPALLERITQPGTEHRTARILSERENLEWAFRVAATDPLTSARLGLLLVRTYFSHRPVRWTEDMMRLVHARGCPDPRLLLELDIACGQALMFKGAAGGVVDLVPRARALGVPAVLVGALRLDGLRLGFQGRLEEARAYIEEAIALADQGGGLGGFAERFDLAIIQRDLGQVVEAEERLLEALGMARASGTSHLVRASLMQLASFYELTGQTAEAAAALEEEGASGEPRIPIHEARVASIQGRVALCRGDLDGARSHLGRAIRLAEELDARDTIGVCEIMVGGVDLLRGEPDRAAHALRSGLAWARRMKDSAYEARATLLIGVGHLLDGRPDEAMARLDRAIAILESSNREVVLRGVVHAYAALTAALLGLDDLAVSHRAASERFADPKRHIAGRSALALTTAHVELVKTPTEASITGARAALEAHPVVPADVRPAHVLLARALNDAVR